MVLAKLLINFFTISQFEPEWLNKVDLKMTLKWILTDDKMRIKYDIDKSSSVCRAMTAQCNRRKTGFYFSNDIWNCDRQMLSRAFTDKDAWVWELWQFELLFSGGDSYRLFWAAVVAFLRWSLRFQIESVISGETLQNRGESMFAWED